MIERQASVIVADDYSHALNGKTSIVGIYSTDISIPVDPFMGNQLVFVFIVEAPPDDPYQTLELRVVLPGGDKRNLELPLSTFVPGAADARRWVLKYPLLFLNPILKPGPIEATVIHEKGEISTGAPFIVLRPPRLPSFPSTAP